MNFEGSRMVLARLMLKKKLMLQGDPAHETIKPALLILSGVMRGVYGGGQAIALHKRGLYNVFDTVVGVSTGAPVAAYFLAGDIERGLTIYWNECATAEFLSVRRALTGDPVMNIDFLGDVFRGETPRNVRLDQEAVRSSRSAFYAGATCGTSGKGVLLNAKTVEPDVVQAVKASLAAPGLSHGNVIIRGNRYLDGAGALPFPAREVIEQFQPTDVLVLANCEHDWKPSMTAALLRLAAVQSLPKEVRDAFVTMDDRFTEGLSFLRNQNAANYAVLWTDGEIGGFSQNPAKLADAALRSQEHLSAILRGE